MLPAAASGRRSLHEIAECENTTSSALLAQIDHERTICNLSSAIRMFVFNYVRIGGPAPEHRRKVAADIKADPFIWSAD
jgi:predicted DNA-binding ribbon-helix-helix protein